MLAALTGCGKDERTGTAPQQPGKGESPPAGDPRGDGGPVKEETPAQGRPEPEQPPAKPEPAQPTAKQEDTKAPTEPESPPEKPEPAQPHSPPAEPEPIITQARSRPDMVVAGGGSPEQLVRKALEPLGGIESFVKPGDKVVLKPNIAWYRTPQQAANTNPDVVAAVVSLCVGAGAKSVTVVEHTRDPWKMSFNASGIEKAVKGAGGRIYAATREDMYTEIAVPQGKAIEWELVVTDILEADVFINLPVAKVHDGAGAVVGMKNLMGTIWQPRRYHSNVNGLHQCIADLNTVLKADLIIADCYRVLLTEGPKGPGKVGNPGKVVAGTDPVAVDSYCLRFLNLKPGDVPYLKLAHETGLGEIDTSRLRVQTLAV